jgi:hypothetical protein
MSTPSLQVPQAESRTASPIASEGAQQPRLIVAGAGGWLGSEVLRQILGAKRHAPVHVLAQGALHPGLHGVAPLQVPETAAGPDATRWPLVAADVGVVMFEPPRASVDRERALWTPLPAQLPALACWLQACGVRTLVVVLPHTRGSLPGALKHGLANLDEHALAALGFERLLIVRSAQLPQEDAGAGWLPNLAGWMLDIFKYMVPPGEQPLRAAKLAELIEVMLEIAPPGLHVVPPDLLWRAAQGSAEAVLGDWFARRPAGAGADA